MANISTGVYGHFGNFSAANQLPNVAAAPTQTRELSVGDLATVGAAVYVCTVATLGAATWTQVGGSPPYHAAAQWGNSAVYVPAAGNSGSILSALWERTTTTGATTPAAGDIMNAQVSAFFSVDAGSGLEFSITNWPAPILEGTAYPWLARFQESSSTGLFVANRAEVEAVTPDQVRVRLPAVIFAVGTSGLVSIQGTYVVGP